MAKDEGLIRPYGFLLVQVNRLADALCIVGALLAAMRLGSEWNAGAVWLPAAALAAFAFGAEREHLFRSWRVAPLHEELSIIWRCWAYAALVVVFLIYVFDALPRPSKAVLLGWLVAVPLLLSSTRLVVRLVVRAGRSAGRNYRTAAIIGANEIGRRIAHRVAHNRWMGIRVAGYFDDRAPAAGRSLDARAVPLMGDTRELVRQVEEGRIDIVYIALPMRAERRIRQLAEQLSWTTASVYFVADFAVFDLLYAQWETLGGVPILRIVDTPNYGFNGVAKRTQDVVLSILLLATLAVPMALIALAIKLTSRGPVLYRQQRHGLDGRAFTIWKFRTMVQSEGDGSGPQATRDDQRVTRVGRLLRRTSLDELPQLFNVVSGAMSLVGPRPHPMDLNDQYRSVIGRFALRHKVKPGITGWAQVNGYRGETETQEKMQRRLEYDLEYINNWSFWFDLRILLLTAARVWKDQNAY